MNFPMTINRMKNGTIRTGAFAFVCSKSDDCEESLSAENHGTKQLEEKFREWAKFAIVTKFQVAGCEETFVEVHATCWKEPDADIVQHYEKEGRSIRSKRVTQIGRKKIRGKHTVLGTFIEPATTG